MNTSRSNHLAGHPFLAALLGVAAMVGSPGSVAAKGCNSPTTREVVVFLDGIVVDRFVLGERTPDNEPAEVKALYASIRESTWKTGIGCQDSVDPLTGQVVSQPAIFIVTRDGFEKTAEMFLAHLVALQGAHHGSFGTYAPMGQALLSHGPTQSALSVFSRATTLTAGTEGWSATVLAEELGIVCNVIVGKVALVREGLSPGVPACSAIAKG